MSFSFLSLLLGCNSQKTVYEGMYKDQVVKVTSVEKKGFSTNTIIYQVQLGKLKPVRIDAESIDIYDRPYSDDLFGSSPRSYADANHDAYQNTIDYDRRVTPTMLYIDPAQYDKNTYNAYADFFQNHWLQLEKKINQPDDYPYIRDHIIGTVYGSRTSFIKIFRGKEADGAYYFSIYPDGTILYDKGNGPEESTGFQGSGLAQKVEMPGKIIRINNASSFNAVKLRNYRDDTGKSMEDYFTVIEGK